MAKNNKITITDKINKAILVFQIIVAEAAISIEIKRIIQPFF